MHLLHKIENYGKAFVTIKTLLLIKNLDLKKDLKEHISV